MNVSQRLATGFPDFMKAWVTGTELANADTPHPFDSHPPLESRIETWGWIQNLFSKLQARCLNWGIRGIRQLMALATSRAGMEVFRG